MRPIPNHQIDQYRKRHPSLGDSPKGENYGYFEVPFKRHILRVVSVSLWNRCPTWEEMCHIKSLWFTDDEIIIQYHPAKSDYVNVHPHCLHLWKPQNETIPTPPTWMIA